ncbi:antirepressor [Leminorella grimontii]|uniref:Antirepressor n=1 Tax=Leminorella grimontii TaxID=82981 RepID=A0AAV5N0X9_9GAMM|nr:BRO family protein [Leminorella grimontii]KFC95710.1 putative phage protein [Leminorella grimontii ATCC 33999 = DSM 5078]GKX54107.1 antirepressor [Leminorella grimontii]VFS60052.1 Uncharacterized phage-encoded protein [Leminorella grimontii]
MAKHSVVPFTFESHSIRAINYNGAPWFVAQDVCSALSIQNVTQAIERLDEDERSMFNIGLDQRPMFDNRVKEISIISESGMYTLVLRCRDAVKKGSIPHRFRKWVTAEVLPSIRKTGAYATPKPRQSTATQLTPLRQTAERLITTGLGKIYPDIWRLVHERFEIDTIQQLSPPQIAEAVEYLNALEGEYLGKETLPAPKEGVTLDDHQLNDVYLLTKKIVRAYKIFREYQIAEHLSGLGSPAGMLIYEHLASGVLAANRLASLEDEFDTAHRRLGLNQYSAF